MKGDLAAYATLLVLAMAIVALVFVQKDMNDRITKLEQHPALINVKVK